VSDISVFPSFFFVFVRSLSLTFEAWHGTAVRVVLATAVALFLCIHGQHLLLWSLPLLWTTLPPSQPKFGYTITTPHLIAFLDGAAHDLCTAWPNHGLK